MKTSRVAQCFQTREKKILHNFSYFYLQKLHADMLLMIKIWDRQAFHCQTSQNKNSFPKIRGELFGVNTRETIIEI